MLSYDDALKRVLDAIAEPLRPEAVPLEAAWGRALARDVRAPTDLPAFANSAIDGYAVCVEDTEGATRENPRTLRVTQTIPAGQAPRRSVQPGETARIFTGAPMPLGADGLVMVEDTQAEDADHVRVYIAGSADYVRPAGSDLRRGDIALEAGAALDAPSIGLLSALNRGEVVCARMPRVALLTTGDEVVPVGDAPLALGQIRDANGPALAAAVREAGAVVVLRQHVRDEAQATEQALGAAAGCDVIVASGGVSVGDFDFVRNAIEQTGTLDFWRIAIKPGKPLVFGQIADALFFGLPGNPVSSLVTFELFVRPVLRRLAGHASLSRPSVTAVLTRPLSHSAGRREFVRARIEWRGTAFHATPTGAQGSHRLASLAGAQAFVIAHEDRENYAAGEAIPAILL